MNRTSMNAIDDISSKELSAIETIFFDIDDTFSSEGKILSEAYHALWALKRAGYRVVPVTGRPAGWCDMIARMWPVDAVIGENGAFYAEMVTVGKVTKLKKVYLESDPIRVRNAKLLQGLSKKVKKQFPKAQWASDQLFREFDLAIDFCEDVPRWPDAYVQKLLEFCRKQGAQAKLSSIHVNTWFGRYDKWSCVMFYLKKKKITHGLKGLVYLGDSPNDEPFFEKDILSVGVANVKHFVHKMNALPRYVTQLPGGEGFAEFAERLLNQ